MKIFDAHFHIINPNFPLFPNNGYLPPYFTIEDYQKDTQSFNIVGGAIVSGSFQQFDQEYLIHSLQQLGKNYVGVANIPINITQKELDRLQKSNIVAVRFNLKRGGSETINNMVVLSNKLYHEYNWHTELYVDSAHLKELKSKLLQLPSFSLDHLGLTKKGLTDIYFWAKKGVKIKATGFGRIDFDPIPVMRKIHCINPKALLFGTDLPSTRAKTPFSIKDIQLIKDNFTTTEQENIFYNNAVEWYQKIIR
ncbi:amidohydrolase family protein [Tenacibaculum sp. IB213877]|uniref:amidohydrolase family protein n=1 Tax=Tenacibaculum sp. IB213877 TaxID=3097351 RepID=UPI002A59D31C|nr:amidohydrolase family protein [Tenacibaculum sp. IB213877]MDY0779770.1 amidohydrolase family protein [Tenacibaculum sp. IB213877]